MSEGPPSSIQDLTLQWVAQASQGSEVACPRCLYLLSGIQEPRCPECGEEFRVGVRLSSKLDVPFLTGLIIQSLAIAPSIGMAIVFWALVPFDWDGMLVSRNVPFMITSAVESIVWAGLIFGWCVVRKNLRRNRLAVRWIMNVCLLALGVVSISILLWII